MRKTDNPIGKVVHYYDKLGVVIIELKSGNLKIGQQLRFKHGDEEFTQTVNSLQIDHQVVEEVKAGDSFGMKVDQPTKEGTLVYLS